MTELQLRKQVVSIMANWLGYSESNGKFKQILDIYNSHQPLPRCVKMLTSYEWCTATVSAAFIKAGLTDIGFKECSCIRMIDLYKAKRRWMERDNYVPKVGDIVMYYWKDGTNYATTDCTGNPNHVGIVADVNGTAMSVIEGNKGAAVAYRALDVNGRYIRGYCLPDYASKADKQTVTSTTAQVKTDPAKDFNCAYAREYTVTASALNIRTGPGMHKSIIKSLPKGEKVTCYGYYTKNASTVWLYVKTQDSAVGFCSKKYLK